MLGLWAAQPAGGQGAWRQRWPGGTPGSRTPQSVATAGVTLVHTRAVMLIQVYAHWHRAHMHAHTRTPTLSHALGSRHHCPQERHCGQGQS